MTGPLTPDAEGPLHFISGSLLARGETALLRSPMAMPQRLSADKSTELAQSSHIGLD